MATLVVALTGVIPASSAPPDRVEICHVDEAGEWRLLTVPDRGVIVTAHLSHGDGLPGEQVPGTAGQSFDDGCVPRINELLLLQWIAPFSANPYAATGDTDLLAGSLVLEPLAEFAPDGSIVPALATQIPSEANGGISEDLTQITWTLREGVQWSDGSPLTADDVVFTWEYCTNSFCTGDFSFENVVSVVAADDLTVTITFDGPTRYPFAAFVGYASPVIQRAQFQDCVGVDPFACAEQDRAPIGTGPYVVTESRDADGTVFYEWNPLYRGVADGDPFFGAVELRAGGDPRPPAL